MELTKPQIEKINQFLERKNLNYIDVKLEVLDHIVSDIEFLMIENEITFECAFLRTTSKWERHLRETSSFFFGIVFSAPKIVIEKAKKIFWKQYIFLILSYFLPFLILTNYNFEIQNPSSYSFFIVLKVVIIISSITFIYIFFTKNNKIKTTYGFILKTQSLTVLTGIIVLSMFFTNLKTLNGINIGLLCSFLFSTYNYYYFYEKHQFAVIKYNVS